MVDDDSDEMLGERLDSALRVGLDHDRVDVATLLHGSRRRARRIRTQRIAAVVAGAALVVAVPVGYEVANPGAGATSQQAALLPSSSHPAVTRDPKPAVRPDPTAAPSAVPPATEDLRSTAFGYGQNAIPDAFAFTADELPAGLKLDATLEGPGDLVVIGQPCSGAEKRPQSVVGRRWTWSVNPSKISAFSIDLTVTGWAEGQAAPAWRASLKAAKKCADQDQHTLRVVPEVPASKQFPNAPVGQAWVSTSDVNGQHLSHAVVQMGDRIVGIQVEDPDSSAKAYELAGRLAEIQAARLRSGL